MTEGSQREELRDQFDVQDSGVAQSEGDTEEIDAIPVLAHEHPAPVPEASSPLVPRSAISPTLVSLRSAPAVVQAAAVAAGGFVAGAAMVGLARRRRGGLDRGGRRVSAAKGRRGKGARQGSAGELLQIVGSRSLLVDVHLLGSARR